MSQPAGARTALLSIEFNESTDLADWEANLDDSIEADAGERTTRTFGIAGLASDDGKLFFRVERN